MIGVSVSCLRDWRARSKGPRFVRLGYHCVRYDLEDIEAWLKRKTV